MRLKNGNLYTEENFNYYDYVGFTANNVITSKGKLVMGAGNAKQVRDMFSGIDSRFAEILQHRKEDYLMCLDKETRVFAFQTKRHFKHNSPIELVEASCRKLKGIAERTGKLFAIPFPGINHGKLLREDVLKILEDLPDNVHVWEYI